MFVYARVRISRVCREGGLLDDRPRLRVEFCEFFGDGQGVMRLCRGKRLSGTSFRDGDQRFWAPGSTREAQERCGVLPNISIGANAGQSVYPTRSDGGEALAQNTAITECNGDDVVVLSRLNVSGQFEGRPIVADSDYITLCHSEFGRGRGRDAGVVVPCNFCDWIGKLVQPGVVGF